MFMNNIEIRIADVEDTRELLAIYTPYVESTAITFEYDAPTLAEFMDRIEHTLSNFPYLVAVVDGEIAGYAYAGTFKGRPVYDWAVETTIYVKQNMKTNGIGKALYLALEKALSLQNIVNLNACVAYLDIEDKYLTKDSVNFHQHMCYSLVGEFHKCGFKFNRWYNMVWLEKFIGPHPDNPPAVIAFNEIRGALMAIL